MSEQVVRHRGVLRDENGKLTDPSTPDVALLTINVAPGGGSDRPDRGRSGEDIACTVYLRSPIPVIEDGRVVGYTNLVNADELTVRGERFRIVVNTWNLRGRGGLEVLCTRGQG